MEYNDKDIILKCDQLLKLLQRDYEVLGNEGLDITQIDIFTSRLSSFRQIPSDEVLRNIILESKRLFKAKRSELIVSLRQFEQIARYAMGVNHNLYYQFHKDNMINMPDMDLLMHSRNVRVSTDQNFYILSQFGMSTAIRNKLENLNEEFFTQMKNYLRAAKFNGTKKTEKVEKSIVLKSTFESLKKDAIQILKSQNLESCTEYESIVFE